MSDAVITGAFVMAAVGALSVLQDREGDYGRIFRPFYLKLTAESRSSDTATSRPCANFRIADESTKWTVIFEATGDLPEIIPLKEDGPEQQHFEFRRNSVIALTLEYPP
jgi:hypothetical protein